MKRKEARRGDAKESLISSSANSVRQTIQKSIVSKQFKMVVTFNVTFMETLHEH